MAKTSLGAEESVSWSYEEDIDSLIERLQENGNKVVALERSDDAVALDSFSLRDFPLVLLLGNEVNGVPEFLLERADAVLALPQYGRKTSLNVSVAFGVAAYGLVERFRKSTT